LDYLNSHIGYNSPAEELIFQVGVLPQINQNIKDATLINTSKFSGYEEFIEAPLSFDIEGFKLNEVSDYDF
jgi:hypothetical protein